MTQEQEITHPPVDLSLLNSVLGNSNMQPWDLLPVLQQTQAIYGYLPQPALEKISKHLGVPLSRIFGVITFYAQFYLEPRGRHTCRVCLGTACHVKGGASVLDAVKRKLGIRENETTSDLRFTLEVVACLGSCFSAPVVMVDEDYYGCVAPRQVDSILKKYA